MNRLERRFYHQSGFRLARWVLLFSLIGFGFRVQRLDFQPLWGDEGWSFYFAAQPVPDLLALTAGDIHPPLYYLLLKGWLFLHGTGPVEARLLSVALGTLLIPALSILGRRLFDNRVGAAAGAITAAMPLALYYSQEVRMYGLVTVLGVLSTYFLLRAQDNGAGSGRRWTRWEVAHAVTLAAALYTMYYAAFIFLFQFLAVLVTRRRPQPAVLIKSVGPALRSFGGAALLYLPWVLYVSWRLPAYIQNKRAVEGYRPLNFIRFFGDHWVAFSVGHLPAELKLYAWAALPFVLVASLGFIGVLYGARKRAAYLYLYLFGPMLLGYLVNQVVPFTPPFYERTLLLAAPAYWLFVAVGLVWLWDRQFLFVGTVVVMMATVAAVSLINFYTLPRYPHSDYRPLLKDIAARATPADTLLASYQWQLGFYQAYLSPPRPHIFIVPGWGRGWAGPAGQHQLDRDLRMILAHSPRLWFPAYQAAGHMWEDQAEAAIAGLAYPTLLQWYSPETRLTLAGSAGTPLVAAPVANFQNQVRLIAASVGQDRYQAGRGIIPVELTWRKENSLGSEHRVSLRLVDGSGRTWASRDSQPRAGQAFFTDLAVGETLVDRHGLLVPAGTPPGHYRLLLSLRRVEDARPLDLLDSQNQPLGAELLLAEVEVVDPDLLVGAAALPVQTATEAVFGGVVRLVGYSLGDGPFKAGEFLPLNLFWESLAGRPGPLQVGIQLQSASGEVVAAHEAAPVRPTDDWQPGYLLRDPHDVALPPTLPPGQYRLVIRLLMPDNTPLAVAGGSDIVLATVTTIDRPHTFTPASPATPLAVSFNDQARLVGLDLPRRAVRPGETLPLTLYWQGVAPLEKSWTVFVHLVDGNGQIVSQQDQIPGAGQFPTTGWLPGEYLTDPYSLLIPADTRPGARAYRLEIGLYDPNDFSRLPVVEGGKIIGNHVTLVDWPISVE